MTIPLRLYQAGARTSNYEQGTWCKRPSTEQLQEVFSNIQCKDKSKPCSYLKGNTDSTQCNDKVTPFIDSVKHSGSININGGNNVFHT